MSNVVQFPTSDLIHFQFAEQYMRSELRQAFGECVGILHNELTPESIMQICIILKRVADELNNTLGLYEACK